MKKFIPFGIILFSLFFLSQKANAQVIHSSAELPKSIQIQTTTAHKKVANPTIKGYCGQKVKDLKLPSDGWYWIISSATMNQKLVYGKTIYIKGVYIKPKTSLGQIVNVPVRVSHKLKCTKYKKPTSKKAGNYTYYTCTGCGTYLNAHKKTISNHSWIIPVIRSKIPVTMGKVVGASQLITDGKDAFIKITVNSKYRDYITVVNGRKLKICSTFKSGMPSEIPIKITMKDATKTSRKKEYSVRLKIEPDITITRTVINNGTKYRYDFKYNFVGATNVHMRVKEYDIPSMNRVLDTYMTSPASHERSFMRISTNGVNSVGGKLTFNIIVYYGNGKTITRTMSR